MSDEPDRLPRAVVPRRYELRLAPDLEAATFEGQVAIDVDVVTRTDAVELHAIDLEVSAATVTDASGERRSAAVDIDPGRERIVVRLPGALAEGEARLELAFTGELNDQLRGFYRSTTQGDDGTERTIATTQFESTNARRAFPCFDEPDRKATFSVELVIAEGLTAISCGAETHRERLDDGRTLVRFAETMVMSTYLVAFVVGELEITDPVDVGGVPLRVVHAPGKGHLTPFALECGAFALGWLRDYFDVDYPGDKVDLVAIPDFAFGAMENLGCVTFREALLLVDPERSTQRERSQVALVIAHELAHMWFGDLVTMRWWDGIWLKEAFATFMEMACIDAWRPEWRQWDRFALDRSGALDTDALHSTRAIEFPVSTPDEAEAMYDVLTYEKGASIVRMLEQYLSPARFRDGVRHYLTENAFANTDNSDLWDAIEAATGEPVRSTMDTWILQGGFPLVTASADPDGLRLAQRRAFHLGADDGRRWSVPIVLRGAQGSEHRLLLVEDEAVAEVGAKGCIVDAGADGFYRVDYEPALRRHLFDHAAERLSAVERFALVDDAWAAVLGDRFDGPSFLDIARGLAFETDLVVWQGLAAGLRGLDAVLDGPAHEVYQAEVARLAGVALDICGLEPATDDDAMVRELRGLLLVLAGDVGGDPGVIAHARRLLVRQHGGPGGTVDPELFAAALGVVASAGDGAVHADLVDRFQSSDNPQEQLRYLFALARLPGEQEMCDTLELARTVVRTQNAPFLLGRCMANRHQGWLAWELIRDRWDELGRRFPSNSIARMVGGIEALHRFGLADEVEAFFASHPVPQAQRTVDQHVERLRVNVALREREAPRLTAALLGS